MAGNGEALIGLWFDGQKYFADTIDRDVEEQELQVFAETDRWLTLYFQGQEPDFTPPIAFGAKVSGIPQGSVENSAVYSLWKNPDLRGHCQTD